MNENYSIEFVNRGARDMKDRLYYVNVSENIHFMFHRIRGLKRFEFQFELDNKSNEVCFACYNNKKKKDLVMYYTNLSDKRIPNIIDSLVTNAYKELVMEGELY